MLSKLDLDITGSFSDVESNYTDHRDSFRAEGQLCYPHQMTEMTWARISLTASYSVQRGEETSSQTFPFKKIVGGEIAAKPGLGN